MFAESRALLQTLSGLDRKTVYTLCVDNYAPEITKLTHPLMQRWAEKIGADFHVIRERRWPEMPPVYEKLQLYDISRERGDEWSIYIDSDALIHPDFFDPTNHLPMDTVCHNGNDMAGNRWRYDEYFKRDGRHIGSCNWFTIASSLCRDLWRPLDDITHEEALERIYPVQAEVQSGVFTKEHLIDDYVLSRNIARFGLKFKNVGQIQRELNDHGNYLWHQYLISTDKKINGYAKKDGTHEMGMLEILKEWGLA